MSKSYHALRLKYSDTNRSVDPINTKNSDGLNERDLDRRRRRTERQWKTANSSDLVDWIFIVVEGDEGAIEPIDPDPVVPTVGAN
jgi:hypothetical protein